MMSMEMIQQVLNYALIVHDGGKHIDDTQYQKMLSWLQYNIQSYHDDVHTTPSTMTYNVINAIKHGLQHPDERALAFFLRLIGVLCTTTTTAVNDGDLDLSEFIETLVRYASSASPALRAAAFHALTDAHTVLMNSSLRIFGSLALEGLEDASAHVAKESSKFLRVLLPLDVVIEELTESWLREVLTRADVNDDVSVIKIRVCELIAEFDVNVLYRTHLACCILKLLEGGDCVDENVRRTAAEAVACMWEKCQNIEQSLFSNDKDSDLVVVSGVAMDLINNDDDETRVCCGVIILAALGCAEAALCALFRDPVEDDNESSWRWRPRALQKVRVAIVRAARVNSSRIFQCVLLPALELPNGICSRNSRLALACIGQLRLFIFNSPDSWTILVQWLTYSHASVGLIDHCLKMVSMLAGKTEEPPVTFATSASPFTFECEEYHIANSNCDQNSLSRATVFLSSPLSSELANALSRRLVDGRWEVVDSTLECIASIVNSSFGLNFIRENNLLSVVLGLVRHECNFVRASVAAVLAHSCTGIDIIITLLIDEDSDVRRAAVAALCFWTKPHASAAARSAFLIALNEHMLLEKLPVLLNMQEDWEVKLGTVCLLHQAISENIITSEIATPLLIDVLDDPDRIVRLHAARALFCVHKDTDSKDLASLDLPSIILLNSKLNSIDISDFLDADPNAGQGYGNDAECY